MKKFITILSCIICFGSHCKQDDTAKTMLYGNWQATSWKLKGQESGRDFAAVTFAFTADGTYLAKFGDQKEAGTYKLKGDKLYTTGEDKIEKMVKLTKLTPDTIIMDMNRVGDAEELLLVKK